MKRPVVLLLMLCAVVVAGCSQEPELVGNPPLPPGPGETAVATSGLLAMKPAKAVTAAYDAVIAAGGIRLRTGRAAGQVDMRYSPGRAVGVMSSGRERAEVRRVGSTVFVRSTAAYWQHSPVAGSAAQIGASWVSFSRDDARAGGMLSTSDFAQYLGQVLDPQRWDRWGGRRTVRGVPAVAVIDDDRPDAPLWLAATGKPYPLLLAATDDSSWEFLEPGTPARTSPPPGAIDGDDLPTD